MNTRRTPLILLLILAFGAMVTTPTISFAQRISPGDDQPSQEEESSDEEQEKLILPENVEKKQSDENSKKMLNKARLQKLKADSAAMRVEFEEQISQLKADSAAMRRRFQRRIQALKQKITDLEKRLNKQRSTSQPDTDEREMVLPEDAEQSSEKNETDQRPSASEGDLFNPNTASVSELSSIPELSQRLAERIEWYRREVRPFNSREDLRRVPGVDRETYQKIHSYFHEGSY